MSSDEALASRIRKRLRRRKNIEEKRMFGGLAFLLNGHIVVGVWKDHLIARVGPDHYETLLREPEVKEFDITGRAMRGWVMVGAPALETDTELAQWMMRCLGFVETLPPK